MLFSKEYSKFGRVAVAHDAVTLCPSCFDHVHDEGSPTDNPAITHRFCPKCEKRHDELEKYRKDVEAMEKRRLGRLQERAWLGQKYH